MGALPGAVDVIVFAAVAMALICGLPGARVGLFFGIINRARFGRRFIGIGAALGGALLGGFLATMVMLALGAILGSFCGWFFAQSLLTLRHGVLKRFLGGALGFVLGMFLGAILWAIRINQAAALTGAAWGFGIGAVVGALLWLLVLGSLLRLPRVHRNEGGNVVDATFHI